MCCCRMNQRELADFEKLYERFEDKTVKARIKSSGEWYIKKALKYKNMYYIFSFINIGFPLSATVISAAPWEGGVVKLVTAGVSAVAALAASSLALLKCREKWTLYRHTVEKMKKELALYWACGNRGEECELLRALEQCMEDEHNEWYKQTTEPKSRAEETKEN